MDENILIAYKELLSEKKKLFHFTTMIVTAVNFFIATVQIYKIYTQDTTRLDFLLDLNHDGDVTVGKYLMYFFVLLNILLLISMYFENKSFYKSALFLIICMWGYMFFSLIIYIVENGVTIIWAMAIPIIYLMILLLKWSNE